MVRFELSRSLPGLPGGNSLFFCFAKSKVSKRKGDPQSGPLCGSLKKLKVPENLETSRPCRRRTSKFFIRHFQLFQAQPGRVWQSGSPHPCPLPAREGEKGSPCPNPNSFLHPVLAGLSSAGDSGNKFLDVRRRQSRQVSKNSAGREQRKVPVAKRRDPDCGSPFFSLGFFGEAKKSKSPAGASPGMPATCQVASQDQAETT